MSYYARNHLQDDWATQGLVETQARVRAAEYEARWYFDRATRRQKAEFDATMHTLLGITGPRADRARDRARARWQGEIAEVRALLEATETCLIESGEISTELDERWSALIERDEAVVAAE